MDSELRRRFAEAPPEIQDKILRELTKFLMRGDVVRNESLQRAKNKARRAAFALGKRAADDGDDVRLDPDVWGSLFDDE